MTSLPNPPLFIALGDRAVRLLADYMPAVPTFVHRVQSIAMSLNMTKAMIGAPDFAGELPPCQRNQFGRFGHELAFENPALGGGFQQVRRDIRHVFA